MIEPKYPCMKSYSTNDVVNACDRSDSYVFKKFINAAVYVEKTIKKMAPDLQNYERHLAETIKIMKTKRCSCYIDADSCPCHPSMASGDGLKGARSETQVNDLEFLRNLEKLKSINENMKNNIKKRPMQNKISKQSFLQKNTEMSSNLDVSKKDCVVLSNDISSERKQTMLKLPDKNEGNFADLEGNFSTELHPKTQTVCESRLKGQYTDNESIVTTTSSSTLSTCSQITVKRNVKAFVCETKVSLTSFTSFTPSENNNVRQWLSNKLKEQKKKQLAQREEERRKQLEREKILEKERENFRMWLAAKKKDEEKRKAGMERQQKFDQLFELEKQKREIENQIKYQIWLKRKEEAEIAKKNQEQLKQLQTNMEKEMREIANRKAFEEWLEYSRNKPKPLPLNRGLDSLRSSLSVTYVNPIPWVPNMKVKPASQ